MKKMKYFLPICLFGLLVIGNVESGIQNIGNTLGSLAKGILGGVAGNAAINAGVANEQQVTTAKMYAENAQKVWTENINNTAMRPTHAQTFFSSAENYLKVAEAYHKQLNMMQPGNTTALIQSQGYIAEANQLLINARNAMAQAGLQIPQTVPATTVPAANVYPTTYQQQAYQPAPAAATPAPAARRR